MVREFQAVLDGLPGRPPAPLEEYRELIVEMRRRGLTFREIAGVLADRFQVKTDLGAVYDVLRSRGQKVAQASPRRAAPPTAKEAPKEAETPARSVPQPRRVTLLRQVPRPSATPRVEDKVTRSSPVPQPLTRRAVEKPVFEYDESEPLKLTRDL